VTTTIAPADRPASRGRVGRPGRATRLLIAAVVIAGGSWLTGPLLGATVGDPPPTDMTVPLPGAVPAIDGSASTGLTGPTADDRLALDDRLDFWAARVADRPDDFLSLTQLALTEAEGARLTADLAAYDRAAALVDRALLELPAYPPTIRARGAIRFALHDFRGALEDAEQVLQAAPGDAAALALAGDAALELGDLERAQARYDALAATAPGPWLDVRLAHLASVRGDHAGALALARRASLAATLDDPVEAGSYAYAVGEYARMAGDATVARSAFERALSLRPTDLGALIGLARIDAFEGRLTAAMDGLERAAAIAPQPESLALLGDLLAAAGDSARAAEPFATVRLIGDLGDRQGSVDDRVILRFELDHGGDPAAVLERATAGLAIRPDAAGHDLVAWALHRLGRDTEALASISVARGLGADDARLRFHEGAIRLALGDTGAGRELLQAALELGPALDPVERTEGRALVGG
jgi:tetratricopeptide (TPR) repeat protein